MFQTQKFLPERRNWSLNRVISTMNDDKLLSYHKFISNNRGLFYWLNILYLKILIYVRVIFILYYNYGRQYLHFKYCNFFMLFIFPNIYFIFNNPLALIKSITIEDDGGPTRRGPGQNAYRPTNMKLKSATQWNLGSTIPNWVVCFLNVTFKPF